MKNFFIFLLILSLLFLCSCQCDKNTTNSGTMSPSGISSGEKLKIAFVYVGPVGDAGWTFAHDNARKDMEKELNFVETTYMENVPEGADAERVFTKLCEGGYKVIFGTSFGYMDAMENVSKRYPDVVFEHCSGYKTGPGLGTYFGKIEQARYLSGLVAGNMTKSNKIGFVAAHPIPEVIRGINAFTIGVRKVNPKATVHVVWTYTWYDPGKEKEAAQSLLDTGVDVITQHQDTPAPLQAAEAKGVYAIGYNSDMASFAPRAFLTAPIWNWKPFYIKVAKEVKEGKWKSSSYLGNMKDDIVDLAPMTELVPDKVKQFVEKEKKDIIDGKYDLFQGPLKDQEGKERLKEGEKLSDKDFLEMNWFVEGVSGTITK